MWFTESSPYTNSLFFLFNWQDEDLLDEYADEYADLADQDYTEFENEQENTYSFEDEKEEIEEEVEETEAEMNDKGYSSSSNGGGKNSWASANCAQQHMFPSFSCTRIDWLYFLCSVQ